VESVIITTDSDIILASDVSRQLGLDDPPPYTSESQTLTQRVREFRRTLIEQALRETENNIAAAARKLGVDRANLRKIIIDHDIDLE
jgi:transcriptional regulator with GAF, ATPase, and Fis domain